MEHKNSFTASLPVPMGPPFSVPMTPPPPWICSHNSKHVRLINFSVPFLECPSLCLFPDKGDLASIAYKGPHLRRLSQTHAQIIALLCADTRSYWIVCVSKLCPYSNPSLKDTLDWEPLTFAPPFLLQLLAPCAQFFKYIFY